MVHIEGMKTCSKCGIDKAEAMFAVDRSRTDELSPWCRGCRSDYKKVYRNRNRDVLAAKAAQRYELNKSQIKAKRLVYRQTNRDRINKASSNWYHRNRKEIGIRRRLKYASHAEFRNDLLRRVAAYQKANRSTTGPRMLVWRHSDPKRVLRHNISSRVRFCLVNRKHGRSWEKLVGYTLADLVIHLESLFEPGMAWTNYGSACGAERWWTIDHKKPVASFSFVGYDCEGFRRCWALSNLQPMWSSENFSKGASATD